MTSRWRFISDHHLEYGIQRLARILRGSRSGFYRWRLAEPARLARTAAKAVLTERIRTVQADAKGAYGVPRITRELRESGPVVNHKRVARLMRAAGITGRHLRKGKRTTVQDARAPKAPDLLERDFTARRPNVRWCGDITYLPVGKDWMYLATVIDIHSRGPGRRRPRSGCHNSRRLRRRRDLPFRPRDTIYVFLVRRRLPQARNPQVNGPCRVELRQCPGRIVLREHQTRTPSRREVVTELRGPHGRILLAGLVQPPTPPLRTRPHQPRRIRTTIAQLG